MLGAGDAWLFALEGIVQVWLDQFIFYLSLVLNILVHEIHIAFVAMHIGFQFDILKVSVEAIDSATVDCLLHQIGRVSLVIKVLSQVGVLGTE